MKINTKVNTIPSLTWNWLKMNYANLLHDSDYKIKNSLSLSKLPKGVTYKEDDEKYFMSIAPIETGMDKSISTFLFENNVIPSSIIVEQNTKIEKPIIMDFDCKNKTYSFSSQIITAKKDASITIIMNFSSNKNAEGLQIIQTKLHAEKNAKIHLITVQTLGDNFIHLNDIGTNCDENANIEITQIELGAKQTFVGVKSTLKEYQSSFKSDTAYFGRKSQEYDMNYLVNHIGRKTDSQMMVYGTLKDDSKKTYRGTIDFKKGCQGATGNEQEETLLLTPTVENKSIPVILCDEEDVAGEHGATIGKLSNDVLFYMSAHGIEKQKAEKLMCLAKVKRVASKIPSEKIKESISNYIEEAFNE